MMKELRVSLGLFLALLILTGLVYPMIVLGLGQVLFPAQANGSLIEENGTVIGSSLIGQNFAGDGYFHPRPSSAGNGYDAGNSAGSNLAPTSTDLIKAVRDRVAAFRAENNAGVVPVDLVTGSASGLDPDISDAGARFQAPRIAAARHIDIGQVTALIGRVEKEPTFGVLGEARANVLALNRALDQLTPAKR
jgi:K+-transporting ATPase ATPase C chain